MREIASSPSHTQRAHLEALGFASEMTSDSDVAEWSGHGLRLSVRASMTLTQIDAVSLVVKAAKSTGMKDQQAMAREALGIITGKL